MSKGFLKTSIPQKECKQSHMHACMQGVIKSLGSPITSRPCYAPSLFLITMTRYPDKQLSVETTLSRVVAYLLAC